MLGLQRKAAVLLHGHAALAGGGAVLQKVSGVQLDARLGGVQLHADAGLFTGDPCADALAGAAGAVDHKAVVVATAHHGGLGKAGIDIPANELSLGKIHGGVCHRQNGTGGAGLIVAFQIVGGIDAQLLAQNIAFTVQVEVAVVREVHDGIRIRRDAVIHAEGIVLGEGIAHRQLQAAGEAVLAVRAFSLHEQGIAKGFYPVQLARKATVQMVGAVVGFQLVGLAAHAEGGILDAVCIAAHERAAAGAAGGREVILIICHGVVAQHDIHRAVLGRNDDVFNDASVVQNAHRQAAGIGKDVLCNICALFGHTEGLGADLCHWAFASSDFTRTYSQADFHCILSYL